MLVLVCARYIQRFQNASERDIVYHKYNTLYRTLFCSFLCTATKCAIINSVCMGTCACASFRSSQLESKMGSRGNKMEHHRARSCDPNASTSAARALPEVVARARVCVYCRVR